MPQCVVIADDLTGANATGVLLKKMNLSSYSKKTPTSKVGDEFIKLICDKT